MQRHKTSHTKSRIPKLRKRNQIETFYTEDITDQPLNINDVKIQFPFKSREKYESIKNDLHNKTFNPIPDLNPIKQQRRHQRPYYSPKFLNWEADLVFFTSKTKKPLRYMFVINVNTKFLYVIYLSGKSEDEMIDAFMNLFTFKSNNVQCPNGIKINNIRFDGESALNSKRLKDFFNKYNIKYYSNPSPYINKNRVVDRAIRTIRSAFDNLNISNLSLKQHRNIMQEIVAMYNNSVHKSTGLKPIEMTFEQELDYIKNKDRELQQQMKKQHDEGLYDYEPGDDLIVYLPTGKTNVYSKQIYEKIYAKFINYTHGNVVVKYENNYITVPIYLTKRL